MQPKESGSLSSLLGIMLRRQQKSREGGLRRKKKNWPGKLCLSFANNLQKFYKKPPQQIKPPQKQNFLTQSLKRKQIRQIDSSTMIYCPVRSQPGTNRNHPSQKEEQKQSQQSQRTKPKKPFLSKPLMELVQHQKLLKLQEQKDALLEYLTVPTQPIVKNAEVISSVIGRQSSANFRTFNCLSKLMEIKERLFQTMSGRPHTCIGRFRK